MHLYFPRNSYLPLDLLYYIRSPPISTTIVQVHIQMPVLSIFLRSTIRIQPNPAVPIESYLNYPRQIKIVQKEVCGIELQLKQPHIPFQQQYSPQPFSRLLESLFHGKSRQSSMFFLLHKDNHIFLGTGLKYQPIFCQLKFHRQLQCNDNLYLHHGKLLWEL